MKVKAFAAEKEKGILNAFEYELGAISADEVDIDITYCGICHSDLSMLNNDWQISQYPLVPGHEVVGKITALGEGVTHLKVGQTIGVGWFSASCMICPSCLSGDHNLCASAEGILVGRHGGFANKVRIHKSWAIPLPSGLKEESAGPLFCGGITVFNPIIQNNIKPTDRVGVIGIGGLGHMALSFLRAWGCEVTAFSSSPDKEQEAKKMGADHFVNSKDEAALDKLAGSLDLVLVTVNVDLNWEKYVNMLRPKGKLHFVGAVGAITTEIFPLIMAQRSVTASPLGSPATIGTMLEFAERHGIEPVTEEFKLSDVNEAMEHLKSGKARYRIVLKNDLGV